MFTGQMLTAQKENSSKVSLKLQMSEMKQNLKLTTD